MKLIISIMAILAILFAATAVFAGINLPQTGQTTCYDASGRVIPCQGTGQDAEIGMGTAWPDWRFYFGTEAEADCVTDNLTGLMWARNGNLPGSKKTWTEAIDYVTGINNSGGLCGYNDWRLPNINEIESLVNAQEPNTAEWLNAQGFNNVQSDLYWTSTSYSRFAYYGWLLNLYYGHMDIFDKSNPAYVWAVRSGD